MLLGYLQLAAVVADSGDSSKYSIHPRVLFIRCRDYYFFHLLLTLRAFRLGLAHGLSHAMGQWLVMVVVVLLTLTAQILGGIGSSRGSKKCIL